MQYYGYFAQANWEGLKRDCFTPDIVWNMPGHHPLSGRMAGADAVVAFLQALYGAGITVDNVHVGELDNGTIVEKHTGHGEVNGEQYLFPTCTSYEFRDGKISAVQVHTADQHGVDRYMWAQFNLKGIPARLDQ